MTQAETLDRRLLQFPLCEVSTALGRITLESPAEFEGWLAAGQAQDAERAAKKEARTKARGKGTGRRDPQSGDAAAE